MKNKDKAVGDDKGARVQNVSFSPFPRIILGGFFFRSSSFNIDPSPFILSWYLSGRPHDETVPVEPESSKTVFPSDVKH